MPTEFHCKINKGCVYKEQICDLSDDCGDLSDENLIECLEFIRYDFEDESAPFGFFKPYNPDQGKKYLLNHCLINI